MVYSFVMLGTLILFPMVAEAQVQTGAPLPPLLIPIEPPETRSISDRRSHPARRGGGWQVRVPGACTRNIRGHRPAGEAQRFRDTPACS